MLYGERKKGERILDKKPKTITFTSGNQPDFNTWCRELNVSSAYVSKRTS